MFIPEDMLFKLSVVPLLYLSDTINYQSRPRKMKVYVYFSCHILYHKFTYEMP